MPSFGKTSAMRLMGCHRILQLIMGNVVRRYDIIILCGRRSKADQDEAFAAGNSKVRWPDSKHNNSPSQAVDVAPFIDGKIIWGDGKALGSVEAEKIEIARMGQLIITTALFLGQGKRLRWGWDWDRDGHTYDNSFMDGFHFEIVKE